MAVFFSFSLADYHLKLIFWSLYYLPVQQCLLRIKLKTVVKNLVQLSNATCRSNVQLTQILLTELKYLNELSEVSQAGGGLLVWKVIYKRQG